MMIDASRERTYKQTVGFLLSICHFDSDERQQRRAEIIIETIDQTRFFSHSLLAHSSFHSRKSGMERIIDILGRE